MALGLWLLRIRSARDSSSLSILELLVLETLRVGRSGVGVGSTGPTRSFSSSLLLKVSVDTRSLLSLLVHVVVPYLSMIKS
jgi:hypothetical protein